MIFLMLQKLRPEPGVSFEFTSLENFFNGGDWYTAGSCVCW